ncbi:MAG: rhodanese-like domain-containing protein, partial [Thioalkalispiraceae bacterium]
MGKNTLDTMNSQVNEITPEEAYDLVSSKANALLVDVRSHMEYLFIGHPVGAVHVPWIDEPDWNINPDFVREIRQLVLGGVVHEGFGSHNSVPIVLICRSGKRSLEAGNLLLKEGFENVYNVKD